MSEHRNPDQDAALEEGFLAGTLPDEDRRDPFVADVGAALHVDNAVTPTRPAGPKEAECHSLPLSTLTTAIDDNPGA